MTTIVRSSNNKEKEREICKQQKENENKKKYESLTFVVLGSASLPSSVSSNLEDDPSVELNRNGDRKVKVSWVRIPAPDTGWT